MKYIVLETDGEELMFIYPNHIKCTHIDFAEAVQSMRVGSENNWKREFRLSKIISAGFISIDGNCYGRSESLNLDSRIDDTILYRKMFGY